MHRAGHIWRLAPSIWADFIVKYRKRPTVTTHSILFVQSQNVCAQCPPFQFYQMDKKTAVRERTVMWPPSS